MSGTLGAIAGQQRLVAADVEYRTPAVFDLLEISLSLDS